MQQSPTLGNLTEQYIGRKWVLDKSNSGLEGQGPTESKTADFQGIIFWASLIAQLVKYLPAMHETPV